MDDYIGNVIKKLRLEKNLTQSQLADNICSIKQLSRIEKNISNPTSYLLSLIAERLGQELYNYLPYTMDPNVFELKTEIDYVLDLYNKQKHSQALEFLLSSELLNKTENEKINMEVAWLMGALSNYIEVPVTVDSEYYLFLLRKNRKFSTIDELFDSTLQPYDYKVLNSLIVTYLCNHEYLEAENLLLKCISHFEQNYSKISEAAYTRFLYNLSRLYFQQKNYEDASSISKKGIDHCIQINDISFFPDLCNVYGRAQFYLNNICNGKEYIKSYIFFNNLLKPSSDYKNINKILKKRYNL